MNDTRIWSAAQMRALFPHKNQTRASPSSRRCTKKRLCQVHNRFRCAFNVTIAVITGDSLPPISLQQLPVAISFQDLHLLNGYLVELYESFALRHSVIDENSVYILHIRKAYQFIYSSIVADVAFQFWIGFAPLLMPNIATLSTSASSAYMMLACSLVTSSGIR